jgi:hypothetical protein
MLPDPEPQQLEKQQVVAQRLRALQDETPAPYGWEEFRRRSYRRVASPRAGASPRYAAFAAALVLLIAGIASWSRLTNPRATSESGTVAGGNALAEGGGAPAERDVREDAGPDGARTATPDTPADAADRWLASLPKEPVVVHVGTRAAVAGLEDRIAQLDDLLSAERVLGTQPARLTALQHERARLVSSLVQVRYAETLAAESR